MSRLLICVQCNGTGLENQDRHCSSCLGVGKVAAPITTVASVIRKAVKRVIKKKK